MMDTLYGLGIYGAREDYMDAWATVTVEGHRIISGVEFAAETYPEPTRHFRTHVSTDLGKGDFMEKNGWEFRFFKSYTERWAPALVTP